MVSARMKPRSKSVWITPAAWGAVDPARYKRLFLHSINAEALMARFNVSTKFNGDARFLAELCDLGREAAGAWLASSFDRIGRESSVDLRARYL